MRTHPAGTSAATARRRSATNRSSSTSCRTPARARGTATTQFPFGFGLSYTTFQTSGLSATSTVGRNGTVTATFTVTNTGSRTGTEIVPVYVHQPVSAVVVPPQRLAGFARTSLGAGESKVVRVSFRVSDLAVTPGDIDGTARPTVERGSYQVQ